ncbi:MAG: GDYXXLXY domain-containing protein [Leptolyngbyaceae cyanobacterium RM2_2_4]|nr:GDYXXLXY domain-containing protein [Leptolyngbyaceae cyanobacterium SM1_4_3]NJN89196.1 GDYXXLXY domain-containing protein [Leptolyngbyaceae cyanobacterium SL_5_14]NJO49642.1 GDYXXLXY domain-containing protein [Leptolyngbyaceae cyanobacterium RM2_2_4]NJO66682.1 GDYXXLXY domain-containing protein [Leptolyngbyaceae cyanobacterium RM1_405_57]
MPGWRFWLPLAAQVALILAVPAQAVYTQVSGRTAILQTVPVDPYDLLRGYYVTLSYDISRRETLQDLPGGEILVTPDWSTETPSLFESGMPFYVVLQPASTADSASPLPQPWQPVRISGDRPTNLPANQIALQGNYRHGIISYGLEAYYIPEDQRIEINERINQSQQLDGTRAFVVEVKVNAQGQAVPVSLWVGDRNYKF